MLRKAYIFIFFLFATLQAFPTHIVGGEIYYECLGNNNYRIVLKVYRDCYNGIPWFDSPAYIGIYDQNSSLIDTLKLIPPDSDTLQMTINNPCIIPPSNVCVEQCIYVGTANLPPIPGGYTLVYQRCCRNGTILNLVNPGNVGSTYFTHIPDQSLVSCNTSPHFINYPPIFLCVGFPIQFDHSAIDADNDSLVYELCDTYDGGSTFTPQPIPPVGPPYTVVPWAAGYNGANSISANPQVVIDSQTGIITGTPNFIGQWVVGVCVSEYRNGILLGVHKRDFQFNVINCTGLVITSIPSQQSFCFGDTAKFDNSSINASTYHWDFGVPTLTNDTSNQFKPIYIYADTGVYVVTLIGNPKTSCADTATSSFKIYPRLLPTYTRPPAQCILTNSFNFSGTGVTTNKSTYSWDFGPNATPAISTQQNPTGIIFSTTGKHLVVLTIYDHGCTQSFTDTVVVTPAPIPKISPQVGQCINSNSFNFNGTGNVTSAATYSWVFGANAIPTTSTLQNVTGITYNAAGKFPVKLSITDNGCTASSTDTIIIYPLPQAKFKPGLYMGCKPLSVQFTDSSLTGTALKYLWKFGDGDTSTKQNPTHIYFQPGVYTVSLTIITTNGCIDTVTFTIPNMVTVRPGPVADMSINPIKSTITDPNFTFTDQSISSIKCELFFGDGDSTFYCSSNHTYKKPGIYVASQVVTDQFGCMDTTEVTIEITPDVKFWIPNAFTPNDDILNGIFMPINEGVAIYHFMIFDRWGQLLFETNDPYKGWDGTYKKRNCEQDVYVYKIKLTDILGEDKTYIGHVTLMR